MEKFVVITYLFDFYQDLLTDKQRDLINEYYFEDLSLGELAEQHEISRQSAFDTIKKAEQKLLSYEEKLGLFAKYKAQQEILLKVKKECKTIRENLEGEQVNNIQEVIALIDVLINRI